MKKIISTVTIFCFLTTILQAEYYSKKEARKTALNTILLGLGLAAIGYAPLAIEKKDITNPSLNYSKYTWNKQNYGTSNWYAAAQGVVKNTGNVPLKNVKIYIKYYDVNNNLLSSEYTYLDTYWLEPLPVNTEDTWHDIITTMLGEPHRLEVSATYEYDKI
ncbi:MAG: FxLYD domain-containing protein, partial [Endomicrobiia bacterium]